MDRCGKSREEEEEEEKDWQDRQHMAAIKLRQIKKSTKTELETTGERNKTTLHILLHFHAGEEKTPTRLESVRGHRLKRSTDLRGGMALRLRMAAEKMNNTMSTVTQRGHSRDNR